VPGLIRSARSVSALLNNVLDVCTKLPYPGNPHPKAQTELAGQQLQTIAGSGQNADYFLTGDGGQHLSDLRDAALAGAPVWGGETIAEDRLHYGDPDGPSVTFASIQAVAEPPPPVGQDQLPPLGPGDIPGRARYIGNRHFANAGVDGGMVLPVIDAMAPRTSPTRSTTSGLMSAPTGARNGWSSAPTAASTTPKTTTRPSRRSRERARRPPPAGPTVVPPDRRRHSRTW
jgi:hypothetical protein